MMLCWVARGFRGFHYFADNLKASFDYPCNRVYQGPKHVTHGRQPTPGVRSHGRSKFAFGRPWVGVDHGPIHVDPRVREKSPPVAWNGGTQDLVARVLAPRAPSPPRGPKSPPLSHLVSLPLLLVAPLLSCEIRGV